MSVYQDRIQGTDRLLRVRRMKKGAYAALAVLAALLVVARLQAQGMSFKPLFLPVNGLLEIGLMMGLVAMILGFYFRNLEMRGAQRESQRYLMAKFSMGRAATTAGVTLVVAVLLLLPVASASAGSAFTGAPRSFAVAAQGTETVVFTSPDPFGVSFVAYGRVTATDSFTVTLLRNNVTVVTKQVNASETIDIPVEPGGWTAFAEWSLVLENLRTTPEIATLVLSMGVAPTFFTTVPFLLLLCGMANIGWWIGLRPIRDRSKSAALYAGGVTEVDGGERVFSEYVMTQSAPTVAVPAIPAAAVAATPLPPPPPSVPPPPPPPPAVPAVAVRRPEAPPAAAPRAETSDSLAAKGDALVMAMSYPAAVVAYDEALRLQADHVPALLGKATALTAMGQSSDALDFYRRVLRVQPDHAVALLSCAKLLARQARWRDSLEAIEAYLHKRPNDAAALELKGDILSNLGRRPEALAAYDASITIDPTNENVKQKIEEVRVDVPGLLSRALIASASGNYAQALILFDDILEVEPSNVNALIGKAVAYRRSGKPQEALNCLDLVLRIQPNNAAAFLNRGNLLVEHGDYEAALGTFDSLVAVAPDDEEAWTARGDVLTKMGRDDDALRAYEQALRRSPGDEEVQRKIQELEGGARHVGMDVSQELFKVRGVGPARAKALADAGYKTAEDFQKASVDKLAEVKGITRKIAEDLVRHFKGALVEAH